MRAPISYILLLLLFVMPWTPVRAQYYMTRGVTELQAGVNIPFFNFGDKSSIALARHASVGLNVGGAVGYFYSRNVGIELDVNYNLNGVNTGSLSDFYVSTDTVNYQSASATAGSFSDISAVAAMRFDLPVNDYFGFLFKMGLGLRAVHKPDATITLNTITGPQIITETADTRLILAIYTSAGMRFNINDQWSVHPSASFMSSRLDFQFKRNGQAVTEQQHMGALMGSVGVVYHF